MAMVIHLLDLQQEYKCLNHHRIYKTLLFKLYLQMVMQVSKMQQPQLILKLKEGKHLNSTILQYN